MPDKENFDDLLKRLDKLERYKLGSEMFWVIPHLIPTRGTKDALVRFEQVKTVVRQWIAEQSAGMVLDLRSPDTRRDISLKETIDAIRKQLPNVKLIT